MFKIGRLSTKSVDLTGMDHKGYWRALPCQIHDTIQGQKDNDDQGMINADDILMLVWTPLPVDKLMDIQEKVSSACNTKMYTKNNVFKVF